MKKLFVSAVFMLVLAGHSIAQKYEFMQVTTIESIVPGGMGRSRMFTTYPDSSEAKEQKIENLFSLVGINMGDVKKNDADIVKKINEVSKQGWDLFTVTSATKSPSKDYDEGIFLTRYLFRRESQKNVVTK